MSDPILRLGRRVTIEPRCNEEHVDCRLLFIGDRNRQLTRTYAEAIHRLTSRRTPDAAARFLKDSAEILQYYDVRLEGDRVSLELRESMFRDAASLDDLTFEIRVSHATGTKEYPLPIAEFHALGQLLPLLAGDRTEREVAERLRAALAGSALAWAESFIAQLRTDGFVERVPAPASNPFLADPTRPRVTFVGHTSLLVQSQTTSVIFDPLLRHGQGMYHAGRDVTRLPLGAICCSHSHWDHCDVASLLLFDKRIPIVIPRVRRPTIFNPPIVPMLKLIGFTDIREVDVWQTLRFGDIEVVTVPFHGEQDEPDAEIDHYTYVVRANGLTFYGGVDAFRDTFGDMKGDLERVQRDYQPTVAFLPVSRMTYAYRHGGVNGFCRYVDTTLLDKSFQYTAGADAAVEWVRQLGARWVVPYATFTFSKTTPAPQVDSFSRELDKAGMGDRLVALRPLDAITPEDLTNSSSARRRRAFLNRWLRTSATLARTDTRLAGNLLYRGIRRLLRPKGPQASDLHH
jgi:L-ascorbate metabolism protein UlaG (beta-lactamase superfamily)